MERGFSVSQPNWLCQNVPERPLGTESAQRHSRGAADSRMPVPCPQEPGRRYSQKSSGRFSATGHLTHFCPVSPPKLACDCSSSLCIWEVPELFILVLPVTGGLVLTPSSAYVPGREKWFKESLRRPVS